MVSGIELAVYLVVFLGAIYTAFMFFYAQKKFVKGEFKDFINSVFAAAIAFLLGSLLTLLTTFYSGSAYYYTFLLLAGFALLLTSIYFVKSAISLRRVSKIFGFAEVEKEFDEAFRQARASVKHKKPRKRKRKK